MVPRLMSLSERISRQLSHPSGAGGRLIARLMNRGNRAVNAAAIERLELKADDRVLDLGFGGGLALVPLLATGARVTGLDRATDMVTAAERAHQEAASTGRLALVAGDVMSLPFDDGAFDAVLSVNTVYFWRDLPAALREIRRVLAPGGRLVLGIRDPEVMRRVSRDVFTIRPPQEVADAATAAGFAAVRVDSPADQRVHLVVATRE
jgi:arsenite methyltransferase